MRALERLKLEVEVVCFFQISGGLLVLVISKGLCLPDCLSVWHLVGGERLWLAAQCVLFTVV